MSNLQDLPTAQAADWQSSHRTYRLAADNGTQATSVLEGLLVERFAYQDEISQGFVIELHVLSTQVNHPVHELLGEPVQLQTDLADGHSAPHVRSAMVSGVARLRSDGGFTRFRLTLQPWVFQMQQRKHSRVWQDKTVIQIIDELLGPYQPLAAWRWGDDEASVALHIQQGPVRGVHPYCVQYRETDFEFMQRLLAHEGLAWRIEPIDPEHPGSIGAGVGHQLVIFSDSTQTPQDITSASSVGGQGIRFHQAGPTEAQDTLQSLVPARQLTSQGTTLLAWGQHAQHAVNAQALTSQTSSGGNTLLSDWLQHYEPMHAPVDGPAWDSAGLQHLATQRQDARDALAKHWLALGNVRTLRAGTWFSVTQFEQAGARPNDTQQAQDARRQFLTLAITGLGVNNLPKDPARPPQAFNHPALASLSGDAELQSLALEGHACRLHVQRRNVPWRPLPSSRSLSAHGPQTAIVVGPGGSTTPQDGREIYTDELGRIKVRFHWQSGPLADARPDNLSSCWLRVARAWAGPGMGLQRIPRIGDEVVVQFVASQAHLPIVIGSVPNGQGEGGVPATPGGRPSEHDVSAFAHSTDLQPSAQGNLAHNGRSPAWHGGAPGLANPGATAQNNAAALSGFKSKEWGGSGFNQLVWDDSPGQLRTQLATTQHATQLNFGHLIHQADNHRGSFRGTGFELRTDAYGALRAQRGVLLSTYPATLAQGLPSSPAFDNAAGMALGKQALGLAQSFHQAAVAHQTTGLASVRGSQKADHCTLSDTQAPLAALLTAVSGMACAKSFDLAQQDASARLTAPKDQTLPHSTDPLVTVAAKAGLALLAGQQLQWSSDDVLALQAAQDQHWAVGGQMRWHSLQSIGILAGAVRPGDTPAAGSGLTLINNKGPLDVQAQDGTLTLRAQDALSLHSASQHIDWAAAKSISISTAQGARIRIDASGVHSQCPGTLTIHALQRALNGPDETIYPTPAMPKAVTPDCLKRAAQAGSSVVERS